VPSTTSGHCSLLTGGSSRAWAPDDSWVLPAYLALCGAGGAVGDLHTAAAGRIVTGDAGLLVLFTLAAALDDAGVRSVAAWRRLIAFVTFVLHLVSPAVWVSAT
jgi:hypothetical protein